MVHIVCYHLSETVFVYFVQVRLIALQDKSDRIMEDVTADGSRLIERVCYLEILHHTVDCTLGVVRVERPVADILDCDVAIFL